MTLSERQSIIALFALNAVLNAGLLSRLPEIQRALSLSDRQFGWVLSALSLGVLLAMQVAPAATARLGMRGLLLVSFSVSAIAPPVFGLIPAVAPESGFAALFVAMTIYGFVTSLAGVAMNVEADRIALDTGRPLMSRSHGAWSLAFLLTSALAALAIRAGVSPMQQFLAVSAAMAAGTWLIVRPIRPDAPVNAPQRGLVLPGRSTFLLMGFGMLSVVVEIVVRNWAIILVRDRFDAPDWLSALALPALVATLTIGRLLSDSVAVRTGDVALARGMAVVTAIGIALLVLAPTVAVALAACAIIGLGVSASYPVVVSAVARRGDRPAAEGVAAFIVLQNVLAFAAPVGFGALAEVTDQRIALAFLLPFTLFAWVFAPELKRQAPRRGPLLSSSDPSPTP